MDRKSALLEQFRPPRKRWMRRAWLVLWLGLFLVALPAATAGTLPAGPADLAAYDARHDEYASPAPDAAGRPLPPAGDGEPFPAPLRRPPMEQARPGLQGAAPYRYFLFSIGCQPPVGQFNEPYGIAVAPDDTVYVADNGNDRIQAFGTAYPDTWRGEFFGNDLPEGEGEHPARRPGRRTTRIGHGYTDEGARLGR
ncbi:MAG: hypothetical protein ACP5NB_08615, partial [Chloroflexia bacterium]